VASRSAEASSTACVTDLNRLRKGIFHKKKELRRVGRFGTA